MSDEFLPTPLHLSCGPSGPRPADPMRISAPSRPRRTLVSLLPLTLALLALPACGAELASGDDDEQPVDESQRIIELLDIGPGATVADVGAGSGRWARALAEEVGSEGLVYATEVGADMVTDLEDLFREQGLDQATAVLGDQLSTGLAENCCDAVLLRLVYHHFQDPGTMRTDLRRALRPGGRILVIEIETQTSWGELEGVPDRGGHGIPYDSLIEEMTGDGFEVAAVVRDWSDDDEDEYAVVFRVASQSSSR